MFALILESAKLIMMFGLIGTIIVLSHFGEQPAKPHVRSEGSALLRHVDLHGAW